MPFIFVALLFSLVLAAPVVRVPTCPVVLPSHATPRIVGGGEASPFTRSHTVSFHEAGCGGSLISSTWVLTAAHCLVHEGSMARVGGSNSSNGIVIPVKRVIDHPDYEFPKDDITLVELESPAPSSASYMALNSNPNVPADGEFARVAGYGFQKEGFDDDHDALLRKVDVPVMSTKKCIERYFSVHSYLRGDISAEKHLCAGYDGGGCDSCTADSGGPLFVYDDKNRPVQIAIVSFGYGCAREVPGGYTRVSTYVPWMKSVGAIFEEKTTHKAVFGGIVSGASGPNPAEEEEEDLSNVNTSEPAPEHPPSTPPDPALGPATPAPATSALATAGTVTAPSPNPQVSEASSGSSEKPSGSSERPSESSEQTNSTGKPTSPQPSAGPSPKPSPPARLPPNHAVGTPSVDRPPASTDYQGGHGGEGRPRPDANGSHSPKEKEDDESAVGSADGNDSPTGGSIGNDSPAGVSGGSNSTVGGSGGNTDEAGQTDNFGDSDGNAADTEGDDDANTNATDGKTDDESQKPYSESIGPTVSPSATPSATPSAAPSASTSENNGSVNTPASADSDGDANTGIAPNDSDAEEENAESDSSSDEGSTGTTVGPVFVPEPSPGVASSQIGTEDLEKLETSSSPEATESPEDSDATNAEFGDGEEVGLSGLAIGMIVLGATLAVIVVGYLTYFIVYKVL